MDEAIYSIALTQIPRVGAISAKRLLDVAGSATFLFEHISELASQKSLKPWLVDQIMHAESYIEKATKLIEQTRALGIELIPYSSDRYPSRLKECDDAPVLLYYRGENINLNRKHIISIVGTRHITTYGQQVCQAIVRDLQAANPDILILSGLAYGVDICAHRSALNEGLDTIGVLAHGLDRVYPAAHRQIAQEMMHHGGLVSEFPIGTEPDRFNFVSRNRIIAGMSDATLIIESASKGGSLITAEFANTYNRDCFAVPGKISDPYSAGCNKLIKNNQAQLVESAKDILEALDWILATQKVSKQKELDLEVETTPLPHLSKEEELIYTELKSKGETQINELLITSGLPISKLQTLLFGLEMRGIVKAKAGGIYQLT
ncbi:DNA-processing protein DprA [Bacteroides propionicifaciens]|uniref:DNA-processing protein DprA n=1 Tax=Bacteroides propionicifaciens TaxID=392838 RepID=UPI000365EDD0|nr:DNA-processing protein DprA [Bacteroides propionicifaciens]